MPFTQPGARASTYGHFFLPAISVLRDSDVAAVEEHSVEEHSVYPSPTSAALPLALAPVSQPELPAVTGGHHFYDLS